MRASPLFLFIRQSGQSFVPIRYYVMVLTLLICLALYLCVGGHKWHELPGDVWERTLNRLDEKGVSSTAQTCRHFRRLVADLEFLSHHQERVQHLIDTKHLGIINGLLENIRYVCHREERITINYIPTATYENKVEYMAFLLDLFHCKQRPVLDMKINPSQEFVDSISPRFELHLKLNPGYKRKIPDVLRRVPTVLHTLDLSYNCIQADIVNLTQLPSTLHSLNLACTYTGAHIGNLTQLPPTLKYLNLAAGYFGAHIGDLQQLPLNLSTLDLSINNLGEHIGKLQQLPAALHTLILGHNNIGAFIGELRQLPLRLNTLSLTENNIGANIGSLQQLPPRLHKLDLSYNNISAHIGNLKSLPSTLHTLDLNNNNIGSSIGKLKQLPSNLVVLKLNKNNLEDHISELQFLPPTLQTLYLRGNRIRSIDVELLRLQNPFLRIDI